MQQKILNTHAKLVAFTFNVDDSIAAEQRRKNPPLKVVSISYKKDTKKEKKYNTSPTRPKLLTDHASAHAISQDHYAVCFEETIILEAPDLQLSDQGNFYRSFLQLCSFYSAN